MSTAQLTSPDTASGPAKEPAPARRSRLHGLAWLAWRQNRLAVWTVGGAMLLVAAVQLFLHFKIQREISLYHGECRDGGGWGVPACDHFITDVNDAVNWTADWMHRPFFLLPAVVGMFLGAPLLAQEYERGTVRMIRAQSVSPARWLTARLAAPAALVILAIGLFAALNTWLALDMNRLDFGRNDLFPGFTYATIGLAPLAWSLFALAVGVAVGQLVRRTVVSMLVTGVLVLGAELLVRSLRVYFVPVSEATGNLGGQISHWRGVPGQIPYGAWLVDHGPVLANGTRATEADCYHLGDACDKATQAWATYHPNSHFIPMQLVEGGLLLALSAALVFLVYRRVTRSAV
ncbi:ABC transporter permease [Kitasatospora sp. NPDC051984]|uniref:ABC transporter permease n=1 Tax=Kitasatospora sp. NPDC051984 TaxID=3364059 RepID=UPI0037CB52D6